jgi:hypothetical protein
MALKSILRGVDTAIRRSERDAIRRKKEIAKRQLAADKLEALEQIALLVEEFQNKLDQLVTIHQDCSDCINWKEVQNEKPPVEPKPNNNIEDEAKRNLNNFKPNIIDKILFRVAKKTANLKKNLLNAKNQDIANFNERKKKYIEEIQEHKKMVLLAGKILSFDTKGYVEAVNEINPFSELSDFGSSLSMSFTTPKKAIINLRVHEEAVIPKYEITLLKSGKSSTKDMPIGKFNELYQDYVCSCALRIAREVFALLPLTEVIINAKANIVDSITGKLQEQSILSVLIPKETLSHIDFMKIDPSDSMK